ncbi:MAG: hypothetical protein IPL71_15130 [Anaerolineales bacterium]|nr:hypothetical protein [Anaerolineales bacterium]
MKLLEAQRDFEIIGMRDEMYITSALFASLAGYMFMSIYKNNAYTNVFWMLVAILYFSQKQITTNIMKPDEEWKFHGVLPVELENFKTPIFPRWQPWHSLAPCCLFTGNLWFSSAQLCRSIINRG